MITLLHGFSKHAVIYKQTMFKDSTIAFIVYQSNTTEIIYINLVLLPDAMSKYGKSTIQCFILNTCDVSEINNVTSQKVMLWKVNKTKITISLSKR